MGWASVDFFFRRGRGQKISRGRGARTYFFPKNTKNILFPPKHQKHTIFGRPEGLQQTPLSPPFLRTPMYWSSSFLSGSDHFEAYLSIWSENASFLSILKRSLLFSASCSVLVVRLWRGQKRYSKEIIEGDHFLCYLILRGDKNGLSKKSRPGQRPPRGPHAARELLL